jgi:hypothetical protein
MKQVKPGAFTENGTGWNSSYTEMINKGYNGSAITAGEDQGAPPHPFYIFSMNQKFGLRRLIEKLLR